VRKKIRVVLFSKLVINIASAFTNFAHTSAYRCSDGDILQREDREENCSRLTKCEVSGRHELSHITVVEHGLVKSRCWKQIGLNRIS